MGAADAFPTVHQLLLSVLALRVRIRWRRQEAFPSLITNFGALKVPEHDGDPHLDYRITGAGDVLSVASRRHAPLRARNLAHMLYLVEKSLTVDLQMRRADLFFLHAAALEWQGKAHLLVADPGGGKSTLTWGLLHHGFGYLSDELAPIEIDHLQVHAYAHALCLKRQPPVFPLPDATLHLGDTIHVPVAALPGPVRTAPLPLAAIFFLQYAPHHHRPALRSIKPAEAAARLYAGALNPLAHPDSGLTPTLRIAQSVPCFVAATAGLPATCELISATVAAGTTC
ncbi:MAG: hypothetical protein U1E42_03335 [Rhodospirillales bacterium]